MENTTNTQTEAANGQESQSSAHHGFQGEPVKRIATEQPKTESGATEQTQAQVQQAQTQTSTTEEKPAATEPIQKPNFQFLKDAGYDLEDEQAIIAHLNSGRELQGKLSEYEKKAKDYESLDSLALDIDKARKAGIDIDLYWDARKMEPEKLDTKEALRKEFMIRNSQLVSDDPIFAQKKFEREFDAKYGIINKKFSEAELEDMADQIDFAKRSLEVDGLSAKRYLNEFKQKNVTIPEARQEQQGMSKEDSDRVYQQYISRAEEYADSLDVMEIPIGNDKTFNYGLENIKTQVKSELTNVAETLKNIGVDIQTGVIDPEKLGEFLSYRYIVSDLKPLIDYGVEQRNAEIVTTKSTQPAPTQSLAGGSPGRQLTQDEKLAAAWEAKRQAERAASY